MESDTINLIIVQSAIRLIIVLIGITVVVVSLNKRLSQHSKFRKILAIVAGIIFDVAGVYIISTTSTYIFMEFAQSSLSLSLFVFGFLFPILSGYIAGKIVRQNEVVYGLITGIGFIGIWLIFQINTQSLLMSLYVIYQIVVRETTYQFPIPVWQSALSLAIDIGLSTLGGYFAFVQREQNQAKLNANNEISQTS